MTIEWKRWPEEKPEPDTRFMFLTRDDDDTATVDIVTMTYLVEQYGQPGEHESFYWLPESDLLATLPKGEK